MAARLLLALLWVLHWLPLGAQAAFGRGLGALLYRLAKSRRRIALRNLELCFPQMPPDARARLARDHFGWLGRSLLELVRLDSRAVPFLGLETGLAVATVVSLLVAAVVE